MKQTKRKFEVPHVYILLMGLILLCGILSYIVPAGQYDMITAGGREIIDSASYHIVGTPDEETALSFDNLLANEPGLMALKEVYEELYLPLNGDKDAIFGSSDAGNVSFTCPTFHPCSQVADKGVAIHTRAFAKAMKSQHAYKALGIGAKVIAYQVCRIFSDEDKVAALLAAGPK